MQVAARRRSQRVERSARACRACRRGRERPRRARRCRRGRAPTSMFEPLTLSTSSAPARTAVRISSGSNVSMLTRIPRRDQLARRRRRAPGNGRPGVQPMSMTSAPAARKYSAARAHLVARQPRRVVDLGEDLDVPGAVVARGRARGRNAAGSRAGPSAPSPPARRRARRSACGSPSHSPGISTRSVPAGTVEDAARSTSVVISAATVILSTATSYANGGAISASTRRSAGSASVPVTNETRRAAVDGARPVAGVAHQRGSPLRTNLFGVPSSAPPRRDATARRPRSCAPARSPCR